MRAQLTKTSIFSSKSQYSGDTVPKTPLKTQKHENWSNKPIFRFYKKTSTLPRVVWAEKSKNGLGFEIEPNYDDVPTRFQCLTEGKSSCITHRDICLPNFRLNVSWSTCCYICVVWREKIRAVNRASGQLYDPLHIKESYTFQ